MAGSNAFAGAYLDLAPYIKKTNYDLSQFDGEAVDFYNVAGQGQIGLPFGAYPSFIYYNRALFDEAGLAYPPHKVGEKYKMPDGTEKDWDIDTMSQVAMLLTLDKAVHCTERSTGRNHIFGQMLLSVGFDWWLSLSKPGGTAPPTHACLLHGAGNQRSVARANCTVARIRIQIKQIYGDFSNSKKLSSIPK